MLAVEGVRVDDPDPWKITRMNGFLPRLKRERVRRTLAHEEGVQGVLV
jgi:hypothetical protein